MFPDIPDEDLKAQLKSLCKVKRGDGTIESFSFTQTSTGEPESSHKIEKIPVIDDSNTVDYLVKKIGSHMGEITSILKDHVEKNKPVDGKLKFTISF